MPCPSSRGATVQAPPAGAAARVGHGDDLLVELGARLELEGEAALGGGTGLLLDIVEDAHEGLADQVPGPRAKIGERALREEGEVVLGVGRPEHADAEFLDLTQHHGTIGRDAALRRALRGRGVSGFAQGLAKA
ncbi:hypothetical protein [Porphyrobacter sp. AAP82]|uniref:hypothetical protein n=1 Tax=Porphyrobacter sp. AAP82 TaxID=1248917 RepID=UPI00035FE807|nr:hypothetical protein [Porphyrobacter sp. AAP82]